MTLNVPGFTIHQSEAYNQAAYDELDELIWVMSSPGRRPTLYLQQKTGNLSFLTRATIGIEDPPYVVITRDASFNASWHRHEPTTSLDEAMKFAIAVTRL